MISLDCETTGLDLRHGARPYYVTICGDDDVVKYWSWDVCPLTRQPRIPKEDLTQIDGLISSADRIVGQNIRFDANMLAAVGVNGWPWDRTEDTLIAGHVLASNRPHNLTDMGMQYLGVDIAPLEDALHKACEASRRLARRVCPTWRLAKQNEPDMPSAGASCWKYDTWLPRTLVKHLWKTSESRSCLLENQSSKHHAGSPFIRLPESLPGWEYHPPEVHAVNAHPWWTVLRDYSNADSAVTLALWRVIEAELTRRGLTKIYRAQMRLPAVATAMEDYGITLSRDRMEELRTKYTRGSARAVRICEGIAAGMGVELKMPRGPSSDGLSDFVFGKLENPGGPASGPRQGGLCMPVVKRSRKTWAPSLDKSVLEAYEATLPPRSKALLFVQMLKVKRSQDTAVSYLDGYKRFWLPIQPPDDLDPLDYAGWYRMHPHLNQTGTDTLRWSSSSPNEQNISKKEMFNLRYVFGPAPGREWWSLDAKNIELRIPAYEAGETEMVELFERPDDPPYYGSNHLLIFHLLHPDLWALAAKEVGADKAGPYCKKKYASTWYQWTKNGNFAVTYGAVEASGTADRAYHVPGAQARIKSRFRKMEQLNQKCIKFAEKHGYVETMPDRIVDPDRGYPLLCTRTEYGRVLETVPLNYHVSGTAMWIMDRAMVRCHDYLAVRRREGLDAHMIAQVHDELLFDFPKGQGAEPWRTNLPRLLEIRRLIEQGGDDVGVPTPCGLEYHAVSWAEGVSV
jgi:DNA polymerase I-like protein with 3'-5' exonuclease and polymerase domains